MTSSLTSPFESLRPHSYRLPIVTFLLAPLVFEIFDLKVADKPTNRQAGRQLVRSLLTICDIGVYLHPWPMWITELRITRYSAAYAKFERRTKLVISKQAGRRQVRSLLTV